MNNEISFKNGKTLKVLITCGGGIFGVITAYMLNCLDDKYRKHFNDYIDIYAGTSIGAINALFIALHNDSEKLVEAYKEGAKEIFRKSFFRTLNPFKNSKYSSEGIDNFLKKYFDKNIALFDLKERIIIPTVDFKEEEPFIISNFDKKNLLKNLPCWLACASASAAPTYFPPRDWLGRYILIDGGVIENMPIVTTLTAIKDKFNVNYNQIDVLVVGTGCKIPPKERKIEDVKRFWVWNWLKDFLLPFTTISNEMCSTFWGGKFDLHFYEVFNPVDVTGKMDDISQFYPSKKYPEGKLHILAERYFDDFREVWEKFINA